MECANKDPQHPFVTLQDISNSAMKDERFDFQEEEMIVTKFQESLCSSSLNITF